MKNYLLVVLVISVFYSCSPNNVKEDNSLGKYFEENKVKGAFALMDNGTGRFTVYNLHRYRDSSYLPASTFKIVNSLIGLQTGVITNDSMIIKWDSIKRRDAWDRDLSMYQAFRVSAVNYFQEVARRIGKDTMQSYLDTLSYGTKKITTTVDSFWLDNSLKITPDEQLGLVKRLYFEQLPFFASNQKIVKRAMTIEDNTTYTLAFKTGWGRHDWGKSGATNIGWMIGWIVENRHPYFFVLNIETPDPGFDMMQVREKMLRDILKHLGFFEGKM
jgi:beta-lactamase class D